MADHAKSVKEVEGRKGKEGKENHDHDEEKQANTRKRLGIVDAVFIGGKKTSKNASPNRRMTM